MELPFNYITKVARHAPRLTRNIIQGYVRKRILAPLEYYFGDDGCASAIKQIDLKITHLCNLRCSMCAQWGQSGYNYERPPEKLREVVPFEIYKRVIDDCARFNPLYYIWGGEPMLYPEIMDVLEHITSRGNTVGLINNGTLIEKHAAELVRMNVDSIMISLDGPRDLHDEIRGVPGTFDKMKAGCEAILAERSTRNRITPILVLLITISKANVSALAETVMIAEELGADFVGVYWSWFTNGEIGKSHTEFMEKNFHITPTSWKGYLLDTVDINIEQLIEEVRRVRALKLKCPVLFVPHLSEGQIKRYYRDPAHTFGYHRCYTPWWRVGIEPNGDVTTCRDYPDVVCGNIKEEPLPVIFNNERYRQFRRVLKSNKLMPVCGRCCGLMGF